MEFFGFFLDFFGGLGFFWEDLFGRISLGGFFGRIFWRIFWENYLVEIKEEYWNMIGIYVFLKILG